MSMNKKLVPMRKQQGFSMLKVMFIGTIFVSLSAFGMKFFPIVYEYYTFKRAIDVTSAMGLRSPNAVRDALGKFFEVNHVRGISEREYSVVRSADGRYDIEYDYSRQVPINSWMRVVMDFKGSTADTN